MSIPSSPILQASVYTASIWTTKVPVMKQYKSTDHASIMHESPRHYVQNQDGILDERRSWERYSVGNQV